MKPKRRLRVVLSVVALVLAGFVLLIPRRHVQLYKVTVLPSLGVWQTRPEAINDRGQVAGFADVAVVGRFHLFIWNRDNSMKDAVSTIEKAEANTNKRFPIKTVNAVRRNVRTDDALTGLTLLSA